MVLGTMARPTLVISRYTIVVLLAMLGLMIVSHSAAINNNNNVVIDARQLRSSPRKDRPVSELARGASAQHTCVLLSGSAGIKCFGPNINGQLGHDRRRNIGDNGFPFDFGDCLRASSLPGGPRAKPKQVATSSTFTCALLRNGTVHCFGDCESGQCGIDPLATNNQTTRDVVDVGAEHGPIIEISAGEKHACAMTSIGRVFCWGGGSNGQLGIGRKVDILAAPLPVPVDLGRNRTAGQVSAGYSHTCVIVDSVSFPGETDLVCFGSCVFGKCGTGQAGDQIEMGDRLPTIEFGRDSRGKRRFPVQVAAGAAHTCVRHRSIVTTR